MQTDAAVGLWGLAASGPNGAPFSINQATGEQGGARPGHFAVNCRLAARHTRASVSAQGTAGTHCRPPSWRPIDGEAGAAWHAACFSYGGLMV